VSIPYILLSKNTDKDFCVTTSEGYQLSQVEGLCADLAKQDFSGNDEPLFMPILSC
jgi:hypothetical protein